MEPKRPPRDNIIRAMRTGIELRTKDDAPPTLVGHLGVFNQWTTIESSWEGTFMERILPGSFAKTFKENRAAMRVTLNHGSDPELGDKVLGPIEELRETETGGYYEVPLFKGIPELVMEGLAHDQYGASWRGSVMKEEWEDRAKRSTTNPDGLPERTIKELRLMEFGPVTFPAYLGATAGLRSLSDDYVVRQLMGDPDKLAQLMAHYSRTALPGAASTTHSEGGSRKAAVIPVHRFQSQGDFVAWLKERA